MRQLKIVKQITNRETPSLDMYLHEVSKVDLLTPEKEIELAQKIKEGDAAALEILTKANLRFVISVAKQYQNQGLTLSDLINEGNLGLIKAAKKFDETRGFKFISYAVWWIRQSILQALTEHSRLVRLPSNKIGVLNKINKVFVEFEQKFERAPTVEEISKEIDIPIPDVVMIMRNTDKHISMDAPFSSSEEDSGSLYDTMASDGSLNPDNNIMIDSMKFELQRSLNQLSHRESSILRLYFGLDKRHSMTLEEIGDRLDLTRERVRQIKEKAIRKLKHTSRSHMLRSYMGN